MTLPMLKVKNTATQVHEMLYRANLTKQQAAAAHTKPYRIVQNTQP